MIKRLLVPVFIVLILISSACGQVVAPSEPEAAPAAEQAADASTQVATAQEAPMLAELVAAGQLPPLEERLPQEPFVVGPGVIVAEADLPDWSPGLYGGTLRMAHGDADWNPRYLYYAQ